MQVQKAIEQLGYSHNEAKVYLSALSLGEAHVSDIANRVKLPRSSVQVIVEKLHKEGLMNFYIKNRYKFWVAETPERLLLKLQSEEETIRAALPTLQALRPREDEKPTVHVLEGVQEIRQVFDDIIATRHHIESIVPEEQFLALFSDTGVVGDFVEARVRASLRNRMLVPNSPAGRSLYARATRELRDVRFLPERLVMPSAIFIYGDKVALVMLNKRQPTAVIIEDSDVYATHSALFEEVWNASSLP